MKRKIKKNIIFIGVIVLAIGGIFVFKDKPLVCTKTVTLKNDVKIVDKVTLIEKNNELSKIKIHKYIDLDEHTDSAYLGIFKKQFENTYKNIKDKKIYDKDNVLYMDAVITEGGYVLNGFNIILSGEVMTVNSNNNTSIASESINVSDDYKELGNKLINLGYECE